MTRFNHRLVLALIVAALVVSSRTASATVIAVNAHYALGEAGSLDPATQLPLDSTGNHNFQASQGAATVDTSTFAPVGGSTASLLFPSNAVGYYSVANPVGGDYPLTGNFEVDLWAKATSAGTSEGANRLISTDGANADSLQIGVTGGNWTANVNLGHAGTGDPVFSTGPAVTTDWTELSLIHANGVTTFYVNGVAQPGTSNAAVVVGTSMHLGVTPGGGSAFAGNLDQVTISTVTPEPGSFVLFGLAAVGLAIVARRRRIQG